MNQKPILEQGATSASNIYGLGVDENVIRFEPANVYYFYQDHEGSVTHVRAVTTGATIESYRYDAFGAPTIRNASGTQLSTSAINNRFMFTGREWAPVNFGFYEYRARAYHPGLGRFMSEDPKGFAAGDYNLYRYCGNDPEDRVDPMGLNAIFSASGDWARIANNGENIGGESGGGSSGGSAPNAAQAGGGSDAGKAESATIGWVDREQAEPTARSNAQVAGAVRGMKPYTYKPIDSLSNLSPHQLAGGAAKFAASEKGGAFGYTFTIGEARNHEEHLWVAKSKPGEWVGGQLIEQYNVASGRFVANGHAHPQAAPGEFSQFLKGSTASPQDRAMSAGKSVDRSGNRVFTGGSGPVWIQSHGAAGGIIKIENGVGP